MQSLLCGTIFKNLEISEKTLVTAKKWFNKFPSLKNSWEHGNLSIFQLKDFSMKNDPSNPEKAVAITLETKLTIVNEKIPCFLLLYYRGTDPHNRDFQTMQARRMGDIAGFDWLGNQKHGIFLTVHHDHPVPEALELGQHRLIADYHELQFRSPRNWLNRILGRLENIPETSEKLKSTNTIGYCNLEEVISSDCPGIVQSDKGLVLRPIGILPGSTLVLANPEIPLDISPAELKEEMKTLANHCMHQFNSRKARVILERSLLSRFQFFPSRRSNISITAVPKNITSDIQSSILSSPLSFILPFIPWHAGRLVFSSHSL